MATHDVAKKYIKNKIKKESELHRTMHFSLPYRKVKVIIRILPYSIML